MTQETFIAQLGRQKEYKMRMMINCGYPVSVVDSATFVYIIVQKLDGLSNIVALAKSPVSAWRIYKDLLSECVPNLEVEVEMLQ